MKVLRSSNSKCLADSEQLKLSTFLPSVVFYYLGTPREQKPISMRDLTLIKVALLIIK